MGRECWGENRGRQLFPEHGGMSFIFRNHISLPNPRQGTGDFSPIPLLNPPPPAPQQDKSKGRLETCCQRKGALLKEEVKSLRPGLGVVI